MNGLYLLKRIFFGTNPLARSTTNDQEVTLREEFILPAQSTNEPISSISQIICSFSSAVVLALLDTTHIYENILRVG
jgi:hypothetical protein